MCATVWKPNGAKSTCQMWVTGKAKLNTGSSPFYRRAISARCFWLLWSRHANVLMLWYWSEMEWLAEHSVQRNSRGIALNICEELSKRMGEQGDYAYSSFKFCLVVKRREAVLHHSHFCLDECRREGLSAWCTCGALVNFKRVKQCTKRISLKLYCLRKQAGWEQLHSIWETYSIPSLSDTCCDHGWFIQIPKFNHEPWANHLLHGPTESPE